MACISVSALSQRDMREGAFGPPAGHLFRPRALCYKAGSGAGLFGQVRPSAQPPVTCPCTSQGGKQPVENKVLEVLVNAGKPLRPGDIAKELGVDSKEVSKAIAELKKEGKVMSPKRCYYAPAE